jgi:hypothetical protein
MRRISAATRDAELFVRHLPATDVPIDRSRWSVTASGGCRRLDSRLRAPRAAAVWPSRLPHPTLSAAGDSSLRLAQKFGIRKFVPSYVKAC